LDGAAVEILSWILFGLFLGATCYNDSRSFRIPNWLVLLGLLAGLILSIAGYHWAGAQASLLGIALGIGVLFLPFTYRLIKGGDVKFLGAIGAFVGWQNILMALLAAAVAGGVISGVLYIFARRDGQDARQALKAKVPYSLALAMGGVMAALSGGFAGGAS
jgi:prepilin peptidase CpaA